MTIEKDSTNASAYFGLGCSNLRLGKTEQAIQNFEKALEVDPGAFGHIKEAIEKLRSQEIQKKSP